MGQVCSDVSNELTTSICKVIEFSKLEAESSSETFHQFYPIQCDDPNYNHFNIIGRDNLKSDNITRYRTPCISKLSKVNTRYTWSLTLREEHRLQVFENRVLRRVFGPKRDEVTGE